MEGERCELRGRGIVQRKGIKDRPRSRRATSRLASSHLRARSKSATLPSDSRYARRTLSHDRKLLLKLPNTADVRSHREPPHLRTTALVLQEFLQRAILDLDLEVDPEALDPSRNHVQELAWKGYVEYVVARSVRRGHGWVGGEKAEDGEEWMMWKDCDKAVKSGLEGRGESEGEGHGAEGESRLREGENGLGSKLAGEEQGLECLLAIGAEEDVVRDKVMSA